MRTAHTQCLKKKEVENRKMAFVGVGGFFERLPTGDTKNQETVGCDKHSRLFLAQPLTPASPQGLSPINPRAHGKLAGAVFFPSCFSHLPPSISLRQELPDITPQTMGPATLKPNLFSHLEPQV